MARPSARTAETQAPPTKPKVAPSSGAVQLEPALFWEFRARVLDVEIAQVDITKARAGWPNDLDVHRLMAQRLQTARAKQTALQERLGKAYPDLHFSSTAYVWDDDAHSLTAAQPPMG